MKSRRNVGAGAGFGQDTAQALAKNTQYRVAALAQELSDAIQDPGATPAQAATAAAGMESLRTMVDSVRQATNDARFAVNRGGAYTPAALARILPGWNQGILAAERALRMASPARFQRYASNVLGQMGGMGIWSWNPNLWGLTAEEAMAYEKAQAQAELERTQLQAQTAVEAAKGDAQVNAINPSMTSTFSDSFQSAMKATASTYNLLLFGAVVGLGIYAYTEYKSAKSKRR